MLLIWVGGVVSTNAAPGDTVITSYHWKGYKISVLGGDLYYYMPTTVNIVPDKPGKDPNVTFDFGSIKKISPTKYIITPDRIGMASLEVDGEAVFLLQVYAIPEPKIMLTGDQQKWKEVISKEELMASLGIEVSNRFGKFEIVGFSLTLSKNGDLITTISRNSLFTDQQRKLLSEMNEGEKLYIEDVIVKNPDGTQRFLSYKKYTIIDSYENEFIRQTLKYRPYTYDLFELQTDLRIKIAGHPTDADRQTVVAFADTLDNLMQSINVYIVDRQPSLTIIFDSINDSLLLGQGYWVIPGGYLKISGNTMFPFYKSYTMIITPERYREPEERAILLQRVIFMILGNFSQSAPDQSLLNYKPFSAYDRYLIQTLYSQNGQYRISNIIDAKFDYPDRTGVYILFLICILCMSFALREAYRYFGLYRLMRKIKSSIVVRIFESLLLSQVPALCFLVLLGLSGGRNEWEILQWMECWLAPLYLLLGLLFLGIDSLLKKIKQYGLQLVINFFLSFISVMLAYQLIYLVVTPQFIDLRLMNWKLIMIPFILTFYRLFSSFQQNKINTLLQEKELELSKQKELKFRSDLNALQARINPHFLYNALNSIASLAHIDANRTEHMAMSLSKLFRYNINKDNGMDASLKEEAEMAAVYLEVEKIRFADKLTYTIELDASLNEFRVPKFILQPLVENAVKHGISQINTQGIIKIRIFELEGKVIIEVHDNGPEFPGGLMSGYGLQNTYEKLTLLYKKTFDIEFLNGEDKMIRVRLGK